MIQAYLKEVKNIFRKKLDFLLGANRVTFKSNSIIFEQYTGKEI